MSATGPLRQSRTGHGGHPRHSGQRTGGQGRGMIRPWASVAAGDRNSASASRARRIFGFRRVTIRRRRRRRDLHKELEKALGALEKRWGRWKSAGGAGKALGALEKG